MMATTRQSTLLLAALFLGSSQAYVSMTPPTQQQQHARRAPTTATTALQVGTAMQPPSVTETEEYVDEISPENPLRVVIAGAGVGGLALAKVLTKNPNMDVQVLERTAAFKRFGGPIQLASNALQILSEMDEDVYNNICKKFTVTGDKMNGIKDGIRSEWYAKFDLKSPAKDRNMPYTGVIDRPDLQEIYLKALPKGTVQNGDGVVRYEKKSNGKGVTVVTDSGKQVDCDVLIGADGIWSAVRSVMRDAPAKGDGSGASYSGYTVFAGELKYDSPDNGQVGYKVYIGPGQYFVITDIGNGNYQWYAFLARPPDSASSTPMPDGSSAYLQGIFEGWSDEIHAILRVTKENEIEQRDLYDRPPSALKSWTDGSVALLGDGIHAMMPNLGQGGCQAIEDAYVIAQELSSLQKRSNAPAGLNQYERRRLVRSAAVQGLSRFASDIIIRGFDTPAKVYFNEEGQLKFENFNYAGIVTKMLQPILPLFFIVQFNFLYDGWRNEGEIDLKATLGFGTIGGLVLLLLFGSVGEAGLLGAEGLTALVGAEGLLDFEAISAAVRELFSSAGL
eukprot:CAMPEP_0168724128 /NCGR_PEP_ID=MMETSP0724-20121128/3475_1 /TAXON_ID=265536 /ORGANISM="Amphiprora sp., Strain CCMP467" /LENGTH=561 /DNA_ID=CAMNT_0008770865 /DNA_START=222 /DNA_END=1907 /DNA_ORIENTATION=+